MHNLMVSKEKDLRPLDYFLLDWQRLLETEETEAKRPEPKPQTVEEKIKIAKMWVEAFNAAQPE
jgi:hypothetical protein